LKNVNKLKEYICPNPFVYAEIQGNGDVKTCCYINKSFGNINRNKIDEIWQSEDIKELRKSILDGSYKYCDFQKCASIKKILQNKIDTTYQIPYELISKAEFEKFEQGFLKPQIVSFEDDLTCNLYCPSCRSKKYILSSKESLEKFNLQINLLKDIGNRLEELWLCGAGDPFASSSYKKLLTQIDLNIFTNLKIRIDTNGILLNEEMWEKVLKHIEQKIGLIAVSVDSVTKETYEDLRRGGKLETLLNNLEFLSKMKKQLGFKFLVRMIVQEKNFKEMKEFVKFGLSLDVDWVVFSKLENWGTYTQDEYSQKAVHLRSHPKNSELLEILKDDIFRNHKVDLGNLTI